MRNKRIVHILHERVCVFYWRRNLAGRNRFFLSYFFDRDVHVGMGNFIDRSNMKAYNYSIQTSRKDGVGVMKKKSCIARLGAWYLSGGVMKIIGRTITILGIIAALVILTIGAVNMFDAAEMERQEAYDTAYAKAQKKEYKRLTKEAEALAKAAEEAAQADPAAPTPTPMPLPASAEEVVVTIEPVPLSLEKHWGPFFAEYVIWAVAVAVLSSVLGWALASLPEWIAAMKAAGPQRVTAGTFLWAGIVAAAVLSVMGLWKILQITNSTLPEVTKILMKDYVVWAVIAVGAGAAIRWLILYLLPTQRNAFNAVGTKVRFAGKAVFFGTLIVFPVLLIGAACAFVLAKWVLAAALAVGAVALLGIGWLTGLVLEALGTCTLIMEPQVKEAEAREHARRNATSWICPCCGEEHANYVGACPTCGCVRPKR